MIFLLMCLFYWRFKVPLKEIASRIVEKIGFYAGGALMTPFEP